jgi:ABC-2 type transport system ATP-binding protein
VPNAKNPAKASPAKPQPKARVGRAGGPPAPTAATTTRSASDSDTIIEAPEQTQDALDQDDETASSIETSPIRTTVIATPILGAARKAAAETEQSAAEAEPDVEIEPEPDVEPESEVEPEPEPEAEPDVEPEAEVETLAPETVEPETAPEPATEAEPEPEPLPVEPEPSKPAPATTSHGPSGPSTRGVVARPASVKRASSATAPDIALSVRGLTKAFGDVVAVDSIDLTVNAGSFFGFVGPNGAGKTTTLSMVTGLLRPDDGVVQIYGVDVWANAAVAKKSLGVLPDRLRLFDRLTGSEFLHHAGALRGLDRKTIANRVLDLERAFGIEHSASRLVSDYSAGMVKKIAIAAAMIHSPRLLVLDEPFESVDPVSGQVIIDILKKFAAAGGTVVLSSHSMDLIERVCDAVAIIADGRVLASGPLADVLDGQSLEQRFVELAGGATAVEGMEWLQSFSD